LIDRCKNVVAARGYAVKEPEEDEGLYGEDGPQGTPYLLSQAHLSADMNNRRHNSDEGHSPTHHLLTRSFRRDGIGRTTELTIALYGATTTTTSTDASRRSV